MLWLWWVWCLGLLLATLWVEVAFLTCGFVLGLLLSCGLTTLHLWLYTGLRSTCFELCRLVFVLLWFNMNAFILFCYFVACWGV